jgi:hypothetical protein
MNDKFLLYIMLFELPQLAESMHVDMDYLEALIDEGRLKALVLQKRLMVRGIDLDRFLEAEADKHAQKLRQKFADDAVKKLSGKS